MPAIKPFKAIHPVSQNASLVVSAIEEMSLETAKSITQINPQSFIHLLVPEIDSNLTGDNKKEIAFKTVRESLADFIKQGVLVKDEDPSIYIYQVFENKKCVSGVWTTTSINDLESCKIKMHEQTKPEREERISSYLENTGLMQIQF